MSKGICPIIIAIILFPTSFVLAEPQVQVYPTTTNANGGTVSGAQMYTKIVSGDYTDQQTGVPTYTLPQAGEYQVLFFPPEKYRYTTDENCSGTIGQDELKVCHVFYTDDATSTPITPIPPEPTPTQTPQSTPQTTPTSIQTPTLAPEPEPQPTTTVATTTPEDPNIQLIKELRAEIAILLQQIVDLLTEKLNQLTTNTTTT